MRLETATYEATKYAIMNYHYSKTMPPCGCSFSVFNSSNEWCGVIVYSKGASNRIASPYKMVQGQVVELVRVALNGKQESTSKAISISLKLLPKLNPLVKIVVSYADTGQNHSGIIYQATNWIYTGVKEGVTKSYINKTTGRKYHSRNVSPTGFKDNNTKRCQRASDCIEIDGTDKHKYIYPIDKKVVDLCKSFSVPFQKAAIA
jgi:hypothetical protein